jgi:hypothetical protein
MSTGETTLSSRYRDSALVAEYMRAITLVGGRQ